MKFRATCFCIALLFLVATSAPGQWSTEYEMSRDEVYYAMVFPADTAGYIVGEDGKVYKSTDGGDSWVSMATPLTEDYYDIFFKDAVEGWVVGDHGAILCTTDGTNWTEHDSSGIMTRDDLNGVWFYGGKGWICGDNGNIWYSTDNGSTWKPATVPYSDDMMDITFVDGYKGYAACDGDGIIYTDDGGVTWSSATVDLGPHSYTRADIEAVQVYDDSIGFATGWGAVVGSDPTIILKTNDYGKTWNTPDTDYSWDTFCYGYDFTIISGQNGDQIVLVGGGSSHSAITIFSHDGGDTWLPSGAFYGEDLRSIAFVPNTSCRVIAVGDEGTIASSDFPEGETAEKWSFYQLPGPGYGGVLALDSYGQKCVAAGANGHIFREDSSFVPGVIAPKHFAPDIHDVEILPDGYPWYVCGDFKYLCRSADQGSTWSQIQHSMFFECAFHGMHWFNENEGILVGKNSDRGAVFETDDGGEHLFQNWSGLRGRYINDVSFAPDNSNIGVAAGDDTCLYTITGGEVWLGGSENVADPGIDFRGCHMVNENVGWMVGDEGIYCKTVDGGVNWTQQDGITTGQDLLDVYFHTEDYGWMCGDDGLILYTGDGGYSWTDISDSYMGSRDINAVHMVGPAGTLFIGARSGMIRSRSDSTTYANIPKDLPFVLHQNYPNPFNPSTTIKFSLQEGTHVSLKVYDVSGKMIKRLLDEYMKEGEHKVRFKPEGLASGVYFYRLEAGSKVTTRKMILLH